MTLKTWILRSEVLCLLIVVGLGVVSITGCSESGRSSASTPTLGVSSPTEESPTLTIPTPTVSAKDSKEEVPTPEVQVPSTLTTEREIPTLEAQVPPTLTPEGDTPTPEAPVPSTPTTDRITLPVERQIAPSELQAQVVWFDGGAGGGRGGLYVPCQRVLRESSESIRIFQPPPLHHLDRNGLYEGEPMLICGQGLSPQSQVTWTLETPEGDSITDTKDSDTEGVSEFLPDFSYVYGRYRVRAVAGNTVLETQFDVLPSVSPKIWVSGNVMPGQTIEVYYSGFEPREDITTVWYQGFIFGSRADYLTSWQTTTDDSGHAYEIIYVPTDICLSNYSILAAQGKRFTSKSWDILGYGFVLDLPAIAIVEIFVDTECTSDDFVDDRLIDSSSRFLHQIDMGTISAGEVKSGRLASTFEVHNLTFDAAVGQSFTIRVTFPQNDFPIARISIVDPNGELAYECSNAVYGCLELQQGGLEYNPDMSGSYTIGLDMFGEGDGAYSISLDSVSDASSVEQKEITLDDTSANVHFEGPTNGWRTAPYGYNGSMHWTYCTDEAVSNWVKWIPQLPASGSYEVFVFVPEHNAGTIQAKYRVVHSGASSEAIVRQADYSNEWVSIGTFRFAADGEEYVYLGDNTGESRSLDITIGFDAIKFVYMP